MILTRNDFLVLGLAVVVYAGAYYLLALNETFLPGWVVWAYSIVVSWSVLAYRFVRTRRAWKEAPRTVVVSARARKRRARKQRYKEGEA